MDTLVTGINQNKNKDAVIKSILIPSDSKLKWYKEKTNIVGCFLGQGLQDLRLPCETFKRADTLLGQKIVFSKKDDRIFVDYIEKYGAEDRTPYATLAKKTGYPADSIRMRYTQILKHRDKEVKGRFTVNENREIMKTIFKQNKNALKHHYTLSDPIWNELGIQLNRPPYIIFDHWKAVIKPRILQSENKIENEDFRRVLIDFFIEMGIRFRSEINWAEIVDDKRFEGMTPAVLSNRLQQMVSAVKMLNPGIERDDITIEDLRQYLDERAKIPYKDKRVSTLIKDFKNIKNSM